MALDMVLVEPEVIRHTEIVRVTLQLPFNRFLVLWGLAFHSRATYNASPIYNTVAVHHHIFVLDHSSDLRIYNVSLGARIRLWYIF